MKFSFRFYHFLGSVKFAVILIALTAAFVAAGTILEALTDSHLYSSNLTYNSPVFKALIWGFFLNIFISAIRRWPFKKRHIPFLITHFGLLMMISGVIVKSYIGVQGSLSILEGGSSNRLFIPNTSSVHLEKKDPINHLKKIHLDYPFKMVTKQNVKFDDVEMRIADFSEHSYENFQTWMKRDQAIINSNEPITLSENDIVKNSVSLHHENSNPWSVIAIKDGDPKTAFKKIYLENSNLQISNTQSKEVLATKPLKELTEQLLDIASYPVKADLDLNFSSSGMDLAALKIAARDDVIIVPLAGENSLLNQSSTHDNIGKHALTFDIISSPTLIILEDIYGDNHLFAFNCHGEIYHSTFNKDNLQSLYSYDEGFGGYRVHTEIPFLDLPCSRSIKELAKNTTLSAALRVALLEKPSLSPPLSLIKKATDRLSLDFSEHLLKLLISWNESSSILLENTRDANIHKIANTIDWSCVSKEEKNACGWLCIFLDEFMQLSTKNYHFNDYLKSKGWPLAYQFEDSEKSFNQKVILFAQQLFSASDELPEPLFATEQNSLKAISAYLLAYGITLGSIHNADTIDQSMLKKHYAYRLFYEDVFLTLKSTHKNLFNEFLSLKDDDFKFLKIKNHFYNLKRLLGEDLHQDPSKEEIYLALNQSKPIDTNLLTADEYSRIQKSIKSGFIKLETPLTKILGKLPSLVKWEDNHPYLELELLKDKSKEYVKLTYDRFGSGLAWPILDGKYLIRFQPEFKEIPYKVRLHSARQINYANSMQPFSYEADIIVTDLRTGKKEEKTISMNNVYETEDGYRFYLSSISPGDESSVQRVQIVVNHDPAKYYLTYAGAFFVSTGMILLFWIKITKKTPVKKDC